MNHATLAAVSCSASSMVVGVVAFSFLGRLLGSGFGGFGRAVFRLPTFEANVVHGHSLSTPSLRGRSRLRLHHCISCHACASRAAVVQSPLTLSILEIPVTLFPVIVLSVSSPPSPLSAIYQLSWHHTLGQPTAIHAHNEPCEALFNGGAVFLYRRLLALECSRGEGVLILPV